MIPFIQFFSEQPDILISANHGQMGDYKHIVCGLIMTTEETLWPLVFYVGAKQRTDTFLQHLKHLFFDYLCKLKILPSNLIRTWAVCAKQIRDHPLLKCQLRQKGYLNQFLYIYFCTVYNLEVINKYKSQYNIKFQHLTKNSIPLKIKF